MKNEPLAIVGIGCRFLGGSYSPQTFWNNLLEGKGCIVDVRSERWNVKNFYNENCDKAGKMHVKSGRFLQEPIDEFDALFFCVSPREAHSLDPQQRILREANWEALEDANALAGSDTGEFMGG